MSTADLFKPLSNTILPPGVERRSGSIGAALSGSKKLESMSFADLLSKESAGQLSTGRPVSIHPGCDVQLSEDQMHRLGVAMDRAEASGAQRALVMIDGMAVKVDVGVRQVVGKVDLQATPVLGEIDAVVQADSAGAQV
ncbi:MAG: hypothetical protein K2Y21_13965 [Phycisphaerales bacterium]|nr:hypothetical protein [Phycisphaerales bacterium]